MACELRPESAGEYVAFNQLFRPSRSDMSGAYLMVWQGSPLSAGALVWVKSVGLMKLYGVVGDQIDDQ